MTQCNLEPNLSTDQIVIFLIKFFKHETVMSATLQTSKDATLEKTITMIKFNNNTKILVLD